MEIIDDFLDQKDFDVVQAFMMDSDLDWVYNDGIDYGIVDSDGVLSFPEKGDKDKFMFFHMFYYFFAPCSTHFERLTPIFQIINPVSLYRIKANLLTRTPNIIENGFHTDILGMSEKKLKQWTTSIFYVNTNNGYTKFEDGTKVESVANRMVTFPANMKHTGASCTDEKTRVVINFNYFK